MDKIDKYIAQQRKILAKLWRTCEAARQFYEKADNRYRRSRDKSASKIADARGIEWHEALRLLDD